MDHLEYVLNPIWIYPTSSRDRILRKQLNESQVSVDSTLEKLENAVNEAVKIASLLNGELNDLDYFLREQSNLLETNQMLAQSFLTLLGLSKGLQENQDRMMFLTYNVNEAQDHFMNVGTCCTNIREASKELKAQLTGISPSTTPSEGKDSSPVADRKAVRAYIQKLGEAPAWCKMNNRRSLGFTFTKGQSPFIVVIAVV
ncbi:hypothetical protein F5146DRAFT_1199554 [Armillaria mellea]|nr:hypothetical protein F5146DRAFT_1199554 [Armillaria mellea]